MPDREKSLLEAKEILDQMGGDPHVAIAILKIAKAVDNDPQKAMALIAIARFLCEA
jgi:hypothetical protein